MRPPLPLWPILLLLAVVAVLGLRAGLGRAGQSETAVITRIAARHAAQGGQGASCTARPAPQPWLWLQVDCGPPGAGLRYHVGPLGLVWQVTRRGQGTAGAT